MRLDVGVLADEGAVDKRLILQQRVEGAQHVRLVVVPAQGIVLTATATAARHDEEAELT